MESSFRSFKRGDCVPCCHLCNNLAGDFPAISVIDKAKFLLKKYEKIFSKDKTADWSEEELLKLDFSLQSFVRNRIAKKRVINTKIKNLELVILGFEPIPYNEKEVQACADGMPLLPLAVLEKKAVGKVLQRKVPDGEEPLGYSSTCLVCGKQFIGWTSRSELCSVRCKKLRAKESKQKRTNLDAS